MKAGRELDRLVGQAFGFEPNLSWQILNPDETASAMRCDSEREAREWLAGKLRRFPDSWLKDYHVGTWGHWLRFSEDISAAWQLVERVREKYFMILLTPFDEGDKYHVSFTPLGKPEWSHRIANALADTAPLAICRAALKLIEATAPVDPNP